MNKNQKLQFLKALENNPRVTNLTYDKDILHRGWEDSIWFSGRVLEFTLDGRYEYACFAAGEVRITVGDDYVVSKGNNEHYDDVREFLTLKGLTTDRKVTDAEIKGLLYFGNNNWFEDHLYDNKGDYWMDDNLDISDGPFWEKPEQLIEYLDEIIHYENTQEEVEF